jgi:hypothetical protein
MCTSTRKKKRINYPRGFITQKLANMSSRTGKNMHESSDQSQDAYDWSEWAWDGVGCQWYRTRIDSNGKADAGILRLSSLSTNVQKECC